MKNESDQNRGYSGTFPSFCRMLSSLTKSSYRHQIQMRYCQIQYCKRRGPETTTAEGIYVHRDQLREANCFTSRRCLAPWLTSRTVLTPTQRRVTPPLTYLRHGNYIHKLATSHCHDPPSCFLLLLLVHSVTSVVMSSATFRGWSIGPYESRRYLQEIQPLKSFERRSWP